MANKSKVKIGNDVLADLGTDAAKWSEAFVQAFRALPDANVAAEQPAELFDPTSGGYLFGWVANMIEAGRSAGYAKGQEDLSDAVKLYSSFDDAMRDGKVMTMIFIGGKATGKTLVSKRLAAVLGQMEIFANPSEVSWPNGDVYNTLTVTLDADDKHALARATWIDENDIPDTPLPEHGDLVPGKLYRHSASAHARRLDAAHEEGRAAILKEGLNADDELPVLRLPDVNAIEFSVATDDSETTLTVDGQVRAVLGKPNTVIVTSRGERYVILREGEALETPPNRVDGE